MKCSDFSALAIKLSGLVLFVIVLARMPEHFEYIRASKSSYATFSTFSVIAPLIIVALFSALLILYPYRIANKLITTPDNSDELPADNLMQIIGIRLVGLLLCFWSISDLVYHFFIYFMYRDMVEASFGAGTYDYAALFATIAEFVFASVLVYRAKLISSYINAVGN